MFRRFLSLIAGLLLLCPAILSAQVPTPEQLELLRSMSPEDREALLEQLGVGGGALDGSSSQDGDTTRRRPGRSDSRESAEDREDMSSEVTPRDKSLRPDDSVLIEIDFKRDKPARIEPQGPNLPPITIPAEPAPVFEEAERRELETVINQIRARNPYVLDSSGLLNLPGFQPVVLAGLTEEQATLRLGAIPRLRLLELKVRRLPARKQGVAALKPFGYDLFKDKASTFAPFTDVPVPSSYIVGPGDRLVVQLYGAQNRTLRLAVGRDGRINFPELGPITVGGLSFQAASDEIEKRIAQQMIGVRASVSMGDTRSIQVFVMGEAVRPGSYTVSGLATITSALYVSGGIKAIGSLRDIQLKRQGAVIRRLDLYDLLLRGDTSDDANLLPGDVIFIPPLTSAVSVDGEVRRPAIYEIRGESSVSDVIALAGGLTDQADPRRAALVRINEQRARVVLDVPLDTPAGRSENMRRGDALRVLRLPPTINEGVVLEGHIFAPGPVAWRKGLRIADVFRSVDDLRPDADLHYVLVRREVPPDRHVEIFSTDLSAALRDPTSPANLELQPRDRVMVFDQASGRREYIEPLLSEMRRQSSIESPTAVVRIDGRVKSRGDYPLEPGMRVSDLLRAGGGLQDAAYSGKAELTRYRLAGEMRQTQLLEVDLAAVLRGDTSADIELHPFDFLNVKEVSEWGVQEQVTILGEVRFPGSYPIQRGETLRSVLQRAGGLTSLAFPSGAAFTRSELRDREQEQVNILADRLQSDLAATALQAAASTQGQIGQALTVGQSLLNQLRNTKPVGRLVIDLDRVLESPVGSTVDVMLRDGDRLMIPKIKQEVTVIGEIQTATSHFYHERLTRDDYIALSGGLTRKADPKRIYIVRADGSVVSSENAGWFRRSADVAIRPGDTIVAPLDTERMPALPMWQAVTQIIYNLAIAAAAVNSF